MADEIKARPAEQVGAGQHLAVQRLGPVGADLDRASSRARRTRPGVTQRRLARPVLPLFRAFAVAVQQEQGMPLARARRERVGRPAGVGIPDRVSNHDRSAQSAPLPVLSASPIFRIM
jgi:hypothetical protein